jgi:hypothetical protein
VCNFLSAANGEEEEEEENFLGNETIVRKLILNLTVRSDHRRSNGALLSFIDGMRLRLTFFAPAIAAACCYI